MSERREQPAICGLCPEGCWVSVSVSEGKLVSVTPDGDPSYGNLCRRGRLAPRIIYSSDRIKTPMIRSGPKGSAEFRPATWDEALDMIASRLTSIRDVYGARAVASYMGAGTLEESLSDFCGKILAPFGSPNDMDCGSLCYVSSRVIAPITTFGVHGAYVSPDIDKSDIIIVWGTNPLKDGLPEKKRRIRLARERRARLVVIDPRRTSFAKDADLWVPVKPGTDGALALALINLIISLNLDDRDFVANWTAGFDSLRQYAAAFSPEIAGDICGVEPEVILSLARMIGRSQRVAIDFYSGVEYAPSGTQTGRAIYSLIALVGGIDADGGLSINEYPHNTSHENMPDAGSPALGAREHPLFFALTGKAHISGLANGVLNNDPYPVRGLLLVGGSPFLSHTDPDKWQRIYEELDFMLVIDRFMTAESRWADIILPAATYYEINSYQTYRKHISLRHKIISPVGESRSDVAILAAIADRLGYGDAVPRSGRECRERAFGATPDYLKRLHEERSVDLPLPQYRTRKYESGLLRADGKPGFPTPTGKFEFESVLLKKYGYNPLPVYYHPYESCDYTDSKLVLTTGARSKSRFNSQYLNQPELAEENGPELEINVNDAALRGIENGCPVMLVTRHGSVALTAKVTSDICEGTVHAPSGGGGVYQIGQWAEAHINSVIPPDLKDPISGYPVFKAVLCEVNSLIRMDDKLSGCECTESDMLIRLSKG